MYWVTQQDMTAKEQAERERLQALVVSAARQLQGVLDQYPPEQWDNICRQLKTERDLQYRTSAERIERQIEAKVEFDLHPPHGVSA